MTSRDLLIQEVQCLPESLLREILDFIHFLKSKETQDPTDTAIASEATLARDWLRPEEDAAWQGL